MKNMSVKQKYVRGSDVAKMFGVTRQTIRNWVSKKLISGVMVDGALYITQKSLQKLDDALSGVSPVELERYKESLKQMEQTYVESLSELRDCCEGNKALVASRVTLAKFLPVAYEVIRMKDPAIDRGCQILQMLLGGDDIKAIGQHFELSYQRILQIVSDELSELSTKTEDYRTLKEERDKLRDEVERLKINEKSYEAIKVASEQVDGVKPSILTKRLWDCNLSVRALNCCGFADIQTVADLVAYKPDELLAIRCIGKKTLTELIDFVEDMGLEFGQTYVVKDDGTIVKANINK